MKNNTHSTTCTCGGTLTWDSKTRESIPVQYQYSCDKCDHFETVKGEEHDKRNVSEDDKWFEDIRESFKRLEILDNKLATYKKDALKRNKL